MNTELIAARQEIERLQKLNAEMLAALKVAMWELRGGCGVPVNPIPIADQLEEIIARTEGKP